MDRGMLERAGWKFSLLEEPGRLLYYLKRRGMMYVLTGGC
jgi:hypothetical protein